MIIKGYIDEDFVNYKKPSSVILFGHCSFKCEKECGKQICQNRSLALKPDIDISPCNLIERYANNKISKALILSGLEPLDDFSSVETLISMLRYGYTCIDDIVIYTGYNEDEIPDKIGKLSRFPGIIVKFGRYIPDQQPHYDGVLGVWLASDNQYAKRI